MKKSRERTILIAVLSVAGVALLVDRVILDTGVTGPAESSASVLDGLVPGPDPLGQATATDDLGVAVSGVTPSSELAERLKEVSERFSAPDAGQGRDAFSPTEGWSDHVSQGSPDNNAKLVKQFQDGHRLDAVMTIGDQRCAVIDGRTVFVGQELDGYKLRAVDQRSAVFEVGGLNVKIVISTGLSPP